MAVSVRLYYFVVKHRKVDAINLIMHKTGDPLIGTPDFAGYMLRTGIITTYLSLR